MSALLCYGSKSVMSDPTRPVYLRLRDIIAEAILDGTYPEGTMLPSVRAFAALQSVNPLTVAKAYQLFQTAGLVEVRRGVGVMVRPGAADHLRRSEREAFLTGEWPRLRARMERLGLSPADLLAGDRTG